MRIRVGHRRDGHKRCGKFIPLSRSFHYIRHMVRCFLVSLPARPINSPGGVGDAWATFGIHLTKTKDLVTSATSLFQQQRPPYLERPKRYAILTPSFVHEIQ